LPPDAAIEVSVSDNHPAIPGRAADGAAGIARAADGDRGEKTKMNGRKTVRNILGGAVLVALAFAPAAPSTARDLQWIRQLGTDGTDFASAVATDATNNVFVAGGVRGSFDGEWYAWQRTDFFLVKYDTAGTELWRRQFGSRWEDTATSAATDADGNVLVAGSTAGTVPHTRFVELDAVLHKFDADGNDVWRRQFGRAFSDKISSIAIDASGNIYAVGELSLTMEATEAFVRKYDAEGNLLWERLLDGSGFFSASAVATDNRDDAYVIVQSHDASTGSSPVVLKYDPDGNEIWSRNINIGGWTVGARCIAVDARRSLYIAGHSGNDVFLMKYDANGREKWRRAFGTDKSDYATAIATNVDSRLYVAAISTDWTVPGNLAEADAWVAAFELNGHALGTRRIKASSFEFAAGIATDAAKDVYVVGETRGLLGATQMGSSDAFVVKLDPPLSGPRTRISASQTTP
jgi:hypothetical protein